MGIARCPSCKATLDESSNVCPYCGQGIREETVESKSVQENPDSQIIWGLIGFFVPIAGLVLYIIWHSERPLAAKAAGTGALISVIIGGVSGMFGITAMAGMFGRVFSMCGLV